MKIACVSTSRDWIIAPPAESPSVRKIVVSVAALALGLVVVRLAVDQLRDADRDLLGALARLLLDRRELLADALVRAHLLEQRLGGLRVARAASRITCSFTSLAIHGCTSVEPSLFLVWLSKTGSWILTATAATMPSRTSSPAKSLPENSLTALQQALAERAWCVPPSLVYWPFTKLK